MATFQDLPEDLQHAIREIVNWYYSDERQDLAQWKQDTGEDMQDHIFHHLDQVNSFVHNLPYSKKEEWQVDEYMQEESELKPVAKGDPLFTAYDFSDCQPVSMDRRFPPFEQRVSDLFIDEGVCSRLPLSPVEEERIRKVFAQKGSEMLLDGKELIFLGPSIEDALKTELLSVNVGAFKAYYPGFILRLL